MLLLMLVVYSWAFDIMQNGLLPSLELVTKMIEDVELLEEKAKVAKHESSVAGTGILTKVEELKEMLTHAKEANDMVFPFDLSFHFIKPLDLSRLMAQGYLTFFFVYSMLVRFLVRNLF